MIEFARTVEDDVALATEQASRSGDTASSGCFLGGIGFLASVLIGTWSGREVAVVMGAPLRLGGWSGLACGAILGVLVVALTPRLRRRLLQRRIERAVRRGFRRSGRIRLWPDRDGLNVTQDGVHTHLPARAFEGAYQSPTNVLWRWSVPGVEQNLPKRLGSQVNELGWVLADLKARGAVAAASHGIDPNAGARPSPGTMPDLAVQVSQDDLVELACLLSRGPSSRARNRRQISAGRAVVWGFVLVLPAAGMLLPGLGAWILVPTAVAAAVLGAVAWWLAGANDRADVRLAAESTARGLLAASGQERRMWLDGSGVGCADAVIARHVEWAAVRIVEKLDRYFLITSDASASMVLPRRPGTGVDEFVAVIRRRCAAAVPTDRAGALESEG